MTTRPEWSRLRLTTFRPKGALDAFCCSRRSLARDLSDEQRRDQGIATELGPQIPSIAQQHKVKIVAGPFVNREHTVVVVVETERSEDLDAFLMEARLPQWNQVRILPSITMEQAMTDMTQLPALF